MKLAKDIVLIFLSTLFLIIFFEFFVRIFVYLSTKNHEIFFYGVNKNINFNILDLDKFKFNVWQYDNFNKLMIESTSTNSDNKINIWAFGGSTTQGNACYWKDENVNSSSWPNEMKKIDNNIAINNFGKTGSYSDWAIENLIKELNKKNKPDIILWANSFNEINVISYGLKRNKDILKFNFFEKKSNLFISRVRQTFIENLVLYFMLDHIFYRIIEIIGKSNPYSGVDQHHLLPEFQKDVEIAALNYQTNTSEAIFLAKKFDIEFYIVTLSYRDLVIKRKQFFNHYDKIVKNLSNEKDIYWIDTRKLKSSIEKNKNIKLNDLFCDNVHKTLDGNIIIAARIYEFIKKKSNKF